MDDTAIQIGVFGALLVAFPAFFAVNAIRGPRPVAPPIRWHFLQELGFVGFFAANFLLVSHAEWKATAFVLLVLASAGAFLAGGLAKPGGMARRESVLLVVMSALLVGAFWLERTAA